MSADRLRSEVPPAVTAAVGIVVALVSGIFGISAHGLAAAAATGAAAGPPTLGQILTVAAASAGVGVVTAARARHSSPVLTASLGLIAGQGLVHLVLAAGHSDAGHSHGGRSHVGHAPGALGHHVTDPAAVRAAMDGAGLAPAHSSALLTPGMLGAHLAAIVLTLTLVAVLSGTLSWVAARVMPMVATVRLVVVVAALLPSYNADAPRGRFLLARGGTRAPPVSV